MFLLIAYNGTIIFLIIALAVLVFLGYKQSQKIKTQNQRIESFDNMVIQKDQRISELGDKVTEHEKTIRRLDYLLGQSMPLELEGSEKTGRTTRLIAFFINQLFKHKEVEVNDHYPTVQARNLLINKIQERIKKEHPQIRVKVKNGNTLYLKARDDKFSRAQNKADEMGIGEMFNKQKSK